MVLLVYESYISAAILGLGFLVGESSAVPRSSSLALPNNSLDLRSLKLSNSSTNESHSAVQQNFGLDNFRAIPFPILDVGTLYIKGQGNGYAGSKNISINSTNQSEDKFSSKKVASSAPLRKRVDGPIQCGPNQPCLDASCCNSDGKCGYKTIHCNPTAPVTCLSNCNAKAMCGVDALDGAKCGLNLCCSFYGWCGTEQVHCVNADPIGGTTPCQIGYGGCAIIAPPSCGIGSGTASNGRKVAYYQSWNTRNRKCNRVYPHQLNTAGLTHVNLAFASIDPQSFKIIPLDPADQDIYIEFTSLKSATLQTWIAVGGFDFSDPGTATHTTWSDMSSTKANRAAFISSAVAFMNEWGFQGMDIDWEYPATDVRGGKKEDTANLVLLVQELRAAFGTKFGLSSILAPDYWYLRGMDPKSMEPYVDFWGFMAYDLHGSWDSAIATIGPIIKPQTDIREIDKDLLPLWFDKLNPAKINFGMAYYGRGFTVANTSCMYPGCQFIGPSLPALCTDQPGVMSNREIQILIQEKGLVPELLADPMVKQITWDDQWIGYDDTETLNMKLGIANNRCLGGTMIWSIDFDIDGHGSGDYPDGGNTGGSSGGGSSGGSGQSSGTSGPIVYIDGGIWNGPNATVQCEPPCVLVIPPLALPSGTTFPAHTFTTTLWSSTGGRVVTKTTILTVSQFSTSYIGLWPVTVPAGYTDPVTFTPVQSVMPPSFILTLPGTEALIPPTGGGGAPTMSPTNTQTSQKMQTSSSTTFIVPIFFSGSHTVTVQPQPTSSVSLTSNPPVTYTPGPIPTPHCGDYKCGPRLCEIFGCDDHECGLFGCGGGCGITWCPGLGGCSLFTRFFFGCGMGGGGGGGGHGCVGPLCNLGCPGGICPINCPRGICPVNCPGGICPPGEAPIYGGGTDPLTPANPEDPGSDPDPECNQELNITPDQLCSNGNFPFYDVGIKSVTCDYPQPGTDATGYDGLYACQSDADNNEVETQKTLDEAKNCCPSKVARLFDSGLAGRAPQCTPPQTNKYQPLPNGQCHSTYYCDGTRFPNVCANARSAIQLRGRTSILTFVKRSKKHDTDLFPRGKAKFAKFVGHKAIENAILNGPVTGWGLIGCEIEEYPFGSGDPERRLQEDDTLDFMSIRAVNRLIPRAENGAHGRDLSTFYRNAGIAAGGETSAAADGLIYCMAFPGAGTVYPSGQGDDAYLLESTGHNICALPYGVGFTLVTQAYKTYAARPGRVMWDPWFNREPNRLKNTVVYRDEKTQRRRLDFIPPVYCEKPSPGGKAFDSSDQTWKNIVPYNNAAVVVGVAVPQDANQGVNGVNIRCAVPPLTASVPVKRDIEQNITIGDSDLGSQLIVSGNVERSDATSNEDDSTEGIALKGANAKRSSRPKRNVSSGLSKRGIGSYLDSRIYDYLGCPNDDFDPCSDNDCTGTDGAAMIYGPNDGTDGGWVSVEPNFPTVPSTLASTKITGVSTKSTTKSTTKATTSSTPIKPTTSAITASVSIKSTTKATTSSVPIKSTTTIAPTKTSAAAPTKPTVGPYPTIFLLGFDPPAYCFSQHNDGSYVSFTSDEAKQVINSLCSGANSLDPGNPSGYTYTYTDSKVNMVIHIEWSVDQTGCVPEKSAALGGPKDTAGSCDFLSKVSPSACEGGSETANWGGSFVINDGDVGCILWQIYAKAPPPPTTGCNCNGNSCSSTSPACCANGSCTCSCNESGCTPESPACCANGSCAKSKQLSKASFRKLINATDAIPLKLPDPFNATIMLSNITASSMPLLAVPGLKYDFGANRTIY